MNIDESLEILKRNCSDIVSIEELKIKLAKGKKLIVKLGCDPTSPDLHLGHSVVLSKMRQFQDLGHIVVLVIGDFTGAIGDPSGRDSTRPVLTVEQIKKNAETYTAQAFKVLNPKKTKITFNGDWLKPFTNTSKDKTSDLLNSLSKITVSRLLEREDFRTRMKQGNPVTMLEVLYPVFQGYDSVALKADVELGGSDQLFNLLVGRDMQKIFGQTPQIVMTMPLLAGTDGVKKMSKSYDNYIGLTDSPKEMFGKIMSVSDDLMRQYYEILTDESIDKLKKLHPMDAKKNLAKVITAKFHSLKEAEKELTEFERVFSKRQLPGDMEIFKFEKGVKLSALISNINFAPSRNESMRLIDQGAVKLDGEKISKDLALNTDKILVLQVGRKKFCKVEMKK
jgi:tyrosyl-tRNA synthetase